MFIFFNWFTDITFFYDSLLYLNYDVVMLNLMLGVTFNKPKSFKFFSKLFFRGFFPVFIFFETTGALYGQLSLIIVQLLFVFSLIVFIYYMLQAEMGWYGEALAYQNIESKKLFYFTNLNPAANASIVLMYLTFFASLGLLGLLIPIEYYSFIAKSWNYFLYFLINSVVTLSSMLLYVFTSSSIFQWFLGYFILVQDFIQPFNVVFSLDDIYTRYSLVTLVSGNNFMVSYFIKFLHMFVALCFSYIFWQLAYFCKVNRIQYYEYPFFVAFLIVACLLILLSTHLLMVYLLLELQGLCLILLISVSSLLTQSLQTGLRYALINIVGSLFFLYGVVRYVLLTSNSVFYMNLLKLNLSVSDSFLMANASKFNSPEFAISEDFHMFQFIENLINQGGFAFENVSSTSWSIIPFLFMILGLCIKLGVGPFAFWVPNMYSSMHLLALMVFSTIPKLIYISLLIFLVTNNRLLFYVNNIDVLFLIMAVFSLVYGTVGLFKEKYNMFRFVGWSSIINFSLIMLAMSYSLKNINIMFYILVFMNFYIISLLFFLGLFNYLKLTRKFSIMFVDLQLLVRNQELYPLVIIFISSLFSFFGIPPFLGFWGKLMLLKGLVESSLTFMDFVIIAIFFLSILIGGFTYIKLYNLLVSASYKDNTYFTLQPINMYRLQVFYLLFWFTQVIGFLYILDFMSSLFVFN